MKKTVHLFILSVSLLGLCLCHSSLKVYYVKPAGPSSSSSSSECPSSSLPCHSLQYYVSHSNFTNNSRFLFLPGEHHLDSVVDISKVANLSLEGVNSVVKILCNSLPSGFNIRECTGLSIKKMNISNCHQLDHVTIRLESGSELNVDNITFSGKSFATGLKVTNVTGSLNISNSLFNLHQGGRIFTQFNQPSYFNFSNNELIHTIYNIYTGASGFVIHVDCSDVHVLISNCIFRSNYPASFSVFFDLYVIFRQSFNGIVLIKDSVFDRSIMLVQCNSCNLPHVDVMNTSLAMNNVTFAHVSYFWCTGVTVLIVNCTFEYSLESAIRPSSSKLVFQGYNFFRNNLAAAGAGIYLYKSSYMFLLPHTSILFENNHADYAGGAIFIDSQETDPCFFHVLVDSSPLIETIEVNFINNTAGAGGSSLYGNNIAKCDSLHDFFHNISNTESTPSAVASDPYRVCLCENERNQPSCTKYTVIHYIEAFPGENVFLRLAVVDKYFNGVVSGVIHVYKNNASTHDILKFGPYQSSQIANKPLCANFMYTIINHKQAHDNVSISLTTQQHYYYEDRASPYTDLYINVHIKDCPVGFFHSNATGKCECDHILKNNGIKCDVNNQSIFRPTNTWIGFINMSDIPEVMFHPHCPIGYCLPYNTNITSNNSDSQCAPHRTGLLCGKCQEGYSLTLGNGTCATCSNTYLLLILPLAVSGLFLVAILFALNLNVTEGTINGLIFYANVIGMNHSTLYSGEENWLYTFLAWLNLDLGVTTCFYDGMDGYAETWLQFIFPIYLWMIVLVIIKLYSRFPTLANRLGGGNAVKVLATLLILSYTKLQRTVVTIMSFTALKYPDGSIRYVWLYDANIDYLKGKHLYLGLVGISALVFLILPYTLCLVLFQQLQACSNRIPFQWVNRFKPIFDAYAGPYKDKYRLWTGMLLLVRTLLTILFTANTSGSVEFDLLIILTASLALSLASSNGTYKKWPLNFLETFFYLQLGAYAGGMMYARHNSGSVSAVANTCLGLSLAVFLMVIGYHLLLRVYYPLKGYYYRLNGYADIEEDGDVLLSHERFTS